MAYYCIISKHKAIKKSLYAKERINWIYINYNEKNVFGSGTFWVLNRVEKRICL